MSATAPNSELSTRPNVPLQYSDFFSLASVHWGRGCGGVPGGAPDSACVGVDRSRSPQE
ncbi:Ff.00g090930.m01.CDS01 [Fusarium sp. VM40]|nr:Ff.00g090930.m01.CDS01 [Fusarium sp. VM40]